MNHLRRTVLILVSLALLACGDSSISGATAPPVVVAPPPGTGTPPVTAAPSDLPSQSSPLTLVSDVALSPRLRELTLRSPALGGDSNVRLLLPTGYDPAAATEYPVLYLFHGCCDVEPPGYRGWSELTDVEAFTADKPVLVVMPSANSGSLYSDPYNNGLGGGAKWETYHIRELLPWIEAHYKVRRQRGGRLLAGLSMGGGGSFAYAAKYPDLFASAAAYSPFMDTNTARGGPFTNVIETTDMRPANATWGPRTTEEVRWRGHNAFDLAENLAPLKLYILTGDGRPDAATPVAADFVENLCNEMAHNVDAELTRLGIPHFFEDYGPGRHTWPFWQEDLHKTLPGQLAHAASNPAPPASVTYRSIDPEFAVFGWQVAMQREVVEFARLGAASRRGFTLSGSGGGVVTTPAFYPPGAALEVVIDGLTKRLQANSSGQLTIPVDLGPARTVQEYRSGSPVGYLRTATVTITGAAV